MSKQDEQDQSHEPVEGEIVSTKLSAHKYTARGFKGKLSGARSLVLALVFLLVLPLLLLIAIIVGAGYLSEQILPLLLDFVVPVLAISVLALIPLSFFNRTRAWAGKMLYLSSFLYGICAWLLSFVITMELWGVFAVILGLVLLGIGIVPIGVLAALFNAQWDVLLNIAFLLMLAFGVRRYALRTSRVRN